MTEILAKRWQALRDADAAAEVERVEILRTLLIAHDWSLFATAHALNTSDGCLRRILERHAELQADYDQHKRRGKRRRDQVQQ